MSRFRLKFLSPQRTREIASGEVLESKRFNKKTQLPVLGGLFCPRIFGPLEDFQCACPSRTDEKEKKVHRRGEKCSKCGVEFTLKGVTRRHRSGYVHFNVPVINPLAVELLGQILGISSKDMTRVIDREVWVSWEATDSGTIVIEGTPHTITLNEKWTLVTHPSSPKGLHDLVMLINLEETQLLHQKMSEYSQGKEAKLWKKTARFLAFCLHGGVRLSDLFVTDMAIMPPDLRPAYIQGKNEMVNPKSLLYHIMMVKASRLRFTQDLRWKEYPALLKKNLIQEESRSLQDDMTKLLITGTQTVRKTPLKSFIQDLSGKPGHLRNKMMGKRVDFSGRTVITPGPHLTIDEVGIPRKIAYELFRPWILRSLLVDYGFTSRRAKVMLRKKDPLLREVLERVVQDKVVIMNRQPSLHRMSMFCFHIRLHDGKSILLHPMVCAPFNADFDGDQMAIHVPVSAVGLEETKRLMFPSDNLMSPADSSPVIAPSHEMIIGAHDLTTIKDGKPYVCLSNEKAIEAYDRDQIRVNDPVEIRTPARFGGGVYQTCVGRILVEDLFPGLTVTEPLTKKTLKKLISDAYDLLGNKKLALALDGLKTLAYAHVTRLGFSLGINDFVIPSTREVRMSEAREFANDLAVQYQRNEITDEERKERKIRKWMETIEAIQKDFFSEAGPQNPLVIMLKTGARVSMTQVSQLVVAKGMQAKSGGGIIEDPIENCTRTKLTTFEFFVSCYGARKSMADKKMATPLSGYLARRLVNAARDLYISEEDCGYYSEGVEIRRCDALGRTGTSGEYFNEPSSSQKYIKVRSPIFCHTHNGICATCYGLDFSKRKPVALESPVGVIAAQSLTEPCTQLTMRTFHTSGAAELKDSPLVIYSNRKGEVYLESVGEHLLNVYVDKDKYIIHKKLARLLVADEQMVEPGTPLAIYTSKNLANEDIGGKLVLLDSYYEARRLKKRHAAVIAKEAGTVELQPTEEDTKILVLVNGKEQGSVKDTPVFVHQGETVRKGQFLSYGEANLLEYEADLECAANAFVQRVQHLYEQEGITPAPVHIEMIFRSMTELVDNDEENFGLLRFGEPGVRRLLGVTTVGILYPSWLKAIGFGHTKEGLVRAVSTCAVSRDLPSERIMTGEYPLFQLKETQKR